MESSLERSVRMLLGVSLLFVVACNSSTALVDAGADPAGCRAPSACYTKFTGASGGCACKRETLDSCVTCDPTAQATQQCECSATTLTCGTAATVCVGTHAEVCAGAGARCMPFNMTCEMSGGVPPQLVPTRGDGGPELEPRCAFADDHCCP